MKEEVLKSILRECSAYITEKTQEIYTLIPGSGNTNARVMVIGSSPSAKEEATGFFLEGKLGEVFDQFLESVELTREDVYMTYAVKYRPYAISEKTGRIINREVESEEIGLFRSFLMREIDAIRPHLILTLGEIAYEALGGTSLDYQQVLGKKTSATVEELIFDALPLPHPKDKGFKKIAMKDDISPLFVNMKPVKMDESKVIRDVRSSRVDPEMAFERTSRAKEIIGHDEEEEEDLLQTLIKENQFASSPSNKVTMESISNMDYEYEPKPSRGKIFGTRREIQSKSGQKKVIVVYGGSNLADDPTYVVADRVSGVLAELNVTIKRIDLFKKDYSIDAFIDELDDAEGVVIATTVEWFGIGGPLQTFLDRCFNRKRFNSFKGAYLCGIVISRQSYERDAYNHIVKSWEILGGVEGVSIVASIENSADIETDNDLLMAIDKKAEDYYRMINQQRLILPTSIRDHKVFFKMPTKGSGNESVQTDLSTVTALKNRRTTKIQEGSIISNYDEFIEKQQKDIEDISSLFKEKLSTRSVVSTKTFPEIFEYKYKPDKSFADCVICWQVNDRKSESFILDFRKGHLKSKFGKKNDGDVIMTSSFEVLNKIVEGKLTVQRAFMTGDIKAKGNFTLLYRLDQLFAF